MSVFISYARQDAAAVDALAEDLRVAGQQAWRDTELGGGEAWWQTILEHIQTCSVFVFALSDHAIRSQSCRAELDYAKALGIPIVPVQIGPMESLLTAPIAELQVVDYKQHSATAGIRLVTAVTAGAATRRPLPDPLPNPPPAPFTYLQQVANTIAEFSLRSVDQGLVLGQLRRALCNEVDNRAREDTIKLLWQLRLHPDCTYNHAREIDDLLDSRAARAAVRGSRWFRPGSGQEPRTTGSRAATKDDPPRHRSRLLVLTGAVLALIAVGAPIMLVNQDQPAPELVLTGHTRAVNSVAITKLDGRMVIISGSDDGTISIWDPTTGGILRTLTGHTGSVNSVATTELDGRMVIISGSDDGTISIWDPTNGDTLRTLSTPIR